MNSSKANDPMYEVVSPIGDTAVKAISISPPLDTLDGKTICELSDDMHSFETTFPAIRELLQQRYKGVKIVPSNEFPQITMMTAGPDYKKYVETQVNLLKQKGCDAVIIGNGG